MQKNPTDQEINEPSSSFLDTEVFVPIDPNWRKKYYSRVLKKRMCAFFLDIFFCGMIFIATMFLFIRILDHIMPGWQGNGRELPPIGYIIISVSWFWPLPIMESSNWRGTIGKRIMNIQITDNHGNPISFWRSLLRNLLKGLTLYCYAFVVPAWIQISTYIETKKLFHDYFSKTIIGERL